MHVCMYVSVQVQVQVVYMPLTCWILIEQVTTVVNDDSSDEDKDPVH